jgi:uncharacterized protein (UPF0332 family)
MNKTQLDNQTKGARPTLHAEKPDLETLKGLVERAADSLKDARNKANSGATRFNAAYSAAFCLARVALEACGYRIAGAEGHRVTVFQNLANTLEWKAERWRPLEDTHRLRNRFDYGDLVEVSEGQLDAAIDRAQGLLDDVLRVFPHVKPK